MVVLNEPARDRLRGEGRLAIYLGEPAPGVMAAQRRDKLNGTGGHGRGLDAGRGLATV